MVSVETSSRGTGDQTEVLLDRATHGDNAAREQLIRDFVPFALRIASRRAGRYLRIGVDEEVSVAMLAFNQAIDAYHRGHGSFVRFAQTVIQHRLADHWRRRPKQRELLWSELEERDWEGEASYPMLDMVAQAAWQVTQENEQWQLEIAEYQGALEAYGIRFEDLLSHGPKHRDARQRAMHVAVRLIADPEAREYLVLEKALPMKLMVGGGWGTRKTLERHRKYIVAIAIMFLNEWPRLQDFIAQESEGAKKESPDGQATLNAE